MENLRISENFVLLKPIEDSGEVKKSGLIIIKDGNENLRKAEIVSFGKITENSRAKFEHKVGSIAYFLKSDVIEIEFNEQKYFIINYKGIIASKENIKD